MAAVRACVLIADPPQAAADLARGLALEGAEVLQVHTFEQAVALAEARHPSVYVVGYHFDEMRPYRLVRHVRSMPSGADAQVLVIRALPLRQPPKDEEEVRQAYISIGADDYLPLYDGVSAPLEPLRQAIRRRLETLR